MKKEVPLAITLILGLLFIAANYFTGNDALAGIKKDLDAWYLAVEAWVIAVGMVNLTQIHGKRVAQKKDGWFYSAWLMICMFGMLLMSLFVFKSIDSSGWNFMYYQLISPMNATVYATLVFYIGSSAYRAFRFRSMEATILLIVAVVMMLGRVPLGRLLLGGNPFLADAADWFLSVPNSAGMRGIQVGAALGGIATALRLMLGIERNWLGTSAE